MSGERADVLRDLGSIVVAAIACPLALFGGAMLGCATQGFNATCAMSAIFVAPPVLILAGLVTAGLTRGLWGYIWVALGVVIGMFLIFLATLIGGKLLPVDPVTGVIATLWFLAPVTVGYLLGRGGAWFIRTWRQGDRNGDEGSEAA
jgi:hypothetical protein